MQPNQGEGTPLKVTFKDVYGTEAAGVTTDDEKPKNGGFRALLPFLFVGALIGGLIKYYK